MQFVKHIARETKAGYSLVEVLVVVTIMGILSSMGVAGLQAAVANSRVKDAAINTAAFIERVGNESRELTSPICLDVLNNPRILYAVRSNGADCAPSNQVVGEGSIVDSLEIDSPLEFAKNTSSSCNSSIGVDFIFTTSESALFKPRLGLSAVPPQGVVCIKYGDNGPFGLAKKEWNSNSVKAYWKVEKSSGDAGWQEIGGTK